MTAEIIWADNFTQTITTPCISYANDCMMAGVTDDDNVTEVHEVNAERIHVTSDGQAVLVVYFENEKRIYEEIDGDELDIFRNGDIRTAFALYRHPLRWTLM